MATKNLKPAIHVDATRSTIAWFDHVIGIAEMRTRHSHQADNELYAMLTAIEVFGRTRSYASDNYSAISLGKRTTRHLYAQAVASVCDHMYA